MIFYCVGLLKTEIVRNATVESIMIDEYRRQKVRNKCKKTKRKTMGTLHHDGKERASGISKFSAHFFPEKTTQKKTHDMKFFGILFSSI